MASDTPDPGTVLLVARQAILDDKDAVFGYELLYRGGASDTSCVAAGDSASARVLTTALFDLGLETLTGGRPAFVNVTGDLLLSGLDTFIAPGAIVLELLETIDVTPEVVEVCRTLKSKGHLLALDDFEPGSPAEQLFPFVSFVKVDVLATPLDKAAALAARLRPEGVTLLAEKVESRAVHEAMRTAGYSLFQGYHFCKPVTQRGRAIPPQQLAYIQLLAALNKPDLRVQELETIIKQDVSLSVRVLRYANSAAVPLRAQVGTIAQALLFIGIAPIRKWASVWCLAGLSQDAAPEVATLALVRARACELLGEQSGYGNASELFVAGLCSLLDVMLRRPMDEVLQDLRLSAAVTAALSGTQNRVRTMLDAVAKYERGQFDESIALLRGAGVDTAQLPAAYAEALRWAGEVSRADLR